MTVHNIIAWLATISAVLAGVFWVLAARARVDAPPGTAGVGALMGGYLVSQDAKGRYDLHKTLEARRRLTMYDVTKLKSLADCRTVMQRARQRNLPDVYEAVFRRMCQLVGSDNDNPDDPLVKDFYETLAAYEQLLTEKKSQNDSGEPRAPKDSQQGCVSVAHRMDAWQGRDKWV